jgi:hypothetical protein
MSPFFVVIIFSPILFVDKYLVLFATSTTFELEQSNDELRVRSVEVVILNFLDDNLWTTFKALRKEVFSTTRLIVNICNNNANKRTNCDGDWI